MNSTPGCNELVGITISVAAKDIPRAVGSVVTRRVILVVDVSGSMTNAMEEVKSTIQQVYEAINQNDTLGVVAFNHESQVILQHRQKKLITQSIMDDSLAMVSVNINIALSRQAVNVLSTNSSWVPNTPSGSRISISCSIHERSVNRVVCRLQQMVEHTLLVVLPMD